MREKIYNLIKTHDKFQHLISILLIKGNIDDYPNGIHGEPQKTVEEMVQSVLKSHNKSFANFRYLYAYGEQKKETIFEAEFQFRNFANITYSTLMILSKELNINVEEL